MNFGNYGFGPNDFFLSSTPTAETGLWLARMRLLGADASEFQIRVADSLVQNLYTFSGFSKIKALYPMLGYGIGAARVPIIDALNVGAAINTGFVDADLTENGLKGGSGKILDTQIKPSQLGTGSNGGFGFYENLMDYTGTSVQPMGCYNTAGTSRFVLDMRVSVRSFRYGAPANSTGDTSAAANGWYLGQRESATVRKLFYGQTQVSTTNTTSDAAAGASDTNIRLMGCIENPGASVVYWKGRCAIGLLHDGTFTAQEIIDKNVIVTNYVNALLRG